MLIFLAALQAIPHDLYEAARIDGANGWQIATKIKLPNVRGAALLAMAAQRQCDLVVMGCYGHMRLREALLGGVTRTVLQETTLPVLVSH